MFTTIRFTLKVVFIYLVLLISIGAFCNGLFGFGSTLITKYILRQPNISYEPSSITCMRDNMNRPIQKTQDDLRRCIVEIDDLNNKKSDIENQNNLVNSGLTVLISGFVCLIFAQHAKSMEERLDAYTINTKIK
jgi:hypothetical protein